MPIYEFQCTACHTVFDEFVQKVGKRTAKCPECGGKGKKIISNVGIAFKGSGFYVNDSRSGPANDNGPSTASAPKEVSSSDASSNGSSSNGTSSKKSD